MGEILNPFQRIYIFSPLPKASGHSKGVGINTKDMINRKKFVIALGGSIAVPQEINTDFLQRFYNLIKEQIKQGKKFIIVVGGGGVCRKYQKAAAKITKVLARRMCNLECAIFQIAHSSKSFPIQTNEYLLQLFRYVERSIASRVS